VAAINIIAVLEASHARLATIRQEQRAMAQGIAEVWCGAMQQL
jgi:hypothetical protein